MDWSSITLPAAVSYVLMLGLLTFGLGNLLSAIELRKRLARGEEVFARLFREVGTSGLTPPQEEQLQLLAQQGHPAAALVLDLLESPQWADDPYTLDGWSGQALQRSFGRLERFTNLVLALAPTSGLIGTVIGLALGTASMAEDPRPSVLFHQVSIAFGTTLIGLLTMVLQIISLRLFLDPARAAAHWQIYHALALGRRCCLARDGVSNLRTPPGPRPHWPESANEQDAPAREMNIVSAGQHVE